MKHLIVGAGVVGLTTGTFLEANGEDVWYCDKNLNLIEKSDKSKWVISLNYKTVSSFGVFWFCTPETAVEGIIKQLSLRIRKSKMIIVRSTTIPGTLKKLQDKYKIEYLFHIPEFLREATSIEDTFNPDRIVIGGDDCGWVTPFFKSLHCPIVTTNLTTSELIKQISNAWLSTQISFWNEIKELCDAYKVNSQEVANAVTLDKRISKYGSIMSGEPFRGKCLPKDLNNLISCFKEKGLNSYILHIIRNKNDFVRSKYERDINLRKVRKRNKT